MEKLVIEGGHALNGEVEISGAKNAVLPIMAGALLAEGKSVIRHVPRLTDVATMKELLEDLGCETDWTGDNKLAIEVVDRSILEAPPDSVRAMRASFWVLGPLLATRGRASVPLPGGCQIGDRPVDLHLKGLKELGAEIVIREGNAIAHAPDGLKGADIYLGGRMGPSVGATVQIMLAAVLAEGKTVIQYAACEPEIADLGNYLNMMGADILGAGSPRIEINGVRELRGTDYYVIPDRIEAATLLLAGVVTGGEVEVKGVNVEHLTSVLDLLRCANASVQLGRRSVKASRGDGFTAVDVATYPYPGFPTDVQPQIMAAMTTALGFCVISEHVFPDRFMHVAEMNRLGAGIRKHGSHAVVTGEAKLSGAEVVGTDLRACAGLVLLGLVADGMTEVDQIDHLDRGYGRLENKLRKLGAKIDRYSDGKLIHPEILLKSPALRPLHAGDPLAV